MQGYPREEKGGAELKKIASIDEVIMATREPQHKGDRSPLSNRKDLHRHCISTCEYDGCTKFPKEKEEERPYIWSVRIGRLTGTWTESSALIDQA